MLYVYGVSWCTRMWYKSKCREPANEKRIKLPARAKRAKNIKHSRTFLSFVFFCRALSRGGGRAASTRLSYCPIVLYFILLLLYLVIACLRCAILFSTKQFIKKFTKHVIEWYSWGVILNPSKIDKHIKREN